MSEQGYAALDVLRPYNGPCGICGGPDQRHRLADSLVEAYRAGDSATFLVEAYELPEITVAVIEELAAIADRNRLRRKYRWGRLSPSAPPPGPHVSEESPE